VAGVAAAAVAMGAAAQLTPAPEKQQGVGPKLKVENKTLDLGTAWAGEEKQGDFVLVNEGDSTLEITKVKASCGCTVISSYDRKIAPGKKGKIPIKLRTRGMNGTIRKNVTLTTNQEENATATLVVMAKVKRFIDMNPKTGANFGKIRENQVVKKEVELINNNEEPVELKLVRSPHNKFTGQLRVVEPGRKYVLDVQTQPPLPKGYHRGEFKFTTSSPNVPNYTVRASASVTDRVMVMPRRVLIFRPMKNKTKRTVFLRNEGETPVRVLDVSATNELLGLKTQTLKEGQSHRVTLELPAGYMPPASGDKLVIKTDDEEFSELVVPIVRSRPPATRPAARRPVVRRITSRPAK
jgi:hypothetical protein